MLAHASVHARRGLAIGGLAAAAALAASPPAPAATPLKGAAYAGKTSQRQALWFEVSEDGRSLIGLETRLTYTCTGEHDGQAGTFVLDDVRIRGGRFSARQALTGASDTSAVSGGVGTLKGSFKRRGSRAAGTVRSTLELEGGETCDSGRVRFKAGVV